MQTLRFIRQNGRWLAGGFLMYLFSSFGQTFFISLSGGEIRAEYGLTNGQFGSLYMLATLASALTLPTIGRVVDRVPVGRCLLFIMPMLALACLLMFASHSIWLLVLVIYLLRLFGQGMMTHTSLTAMGRWFSAYRGRAVSMATMGHQVGEALLPILLITLFGLVGWRVSWAITAGFILFIALPAVFALMRVERVATGKGQTPQGKAQKQWQREEVLRDPLFWIMLIGVLAPGFIGTTVFFHQDYLLDLRGWPPDLFARSFMAMACMTITFTLITGWLVDKFTAVRILPIFLVPLSLCCFSLSMVTEPHGIFLFMGLLGVSYGISSTLFGSLWPEVYGTMHLGSVRSVSVAMMVLATAMGPGVTGLLIDAGVAYETQFMVMGSYCLLASLVLMFVSRRLRRRLTSA